ncbi:MAG TPA: LPS export ABC transporter ATP-binding protein [Gammaproteobacteria bacterium]|nr:LPS export ABC transporter ATP-binding protein [Gammaproteobacteria bacterium]
MTRLTTRGLVKSYRTRRVVNGVSLHVQQGEIVGLLGPNGAGKTTTFYMIVGLIRADSGEIRLDRTNITHQPMHQRAREGISYLPQEASVFRKLSVEDNILAILETRQDLSVEQRQERLETLLQEMHITHVRESLGQALSGGERRRVEIARALVMEPRFVLLDEPFAGVDPITVVEIQKTIRSLADRGIGVLITDHNVRETLGICDRAYIVSEGRVLTEGSPDHILQHEQVREVYLGEHFNL